MASSSSIYCPTCGAPNESQSAFCANCGRAIQVGGNAITHYPPQGQQNGPSSQGTYPAGGTPLPPPPPPPPRQTGNISSPNYQGQGASYAPPSPLHNQGGNVPSSPNYPVNDASYSPTPPPPYPRGNMQSSSNYPVNGPAVQQPQPLAPGGTPPSSQPPRRRRGRTALIVALVTLVIVVVIGSVLAYAILKSSGQSTSTTTTTATATATTAPTATPTTDLAATATTVPTATLTTQSGTPTAPTTQTGLPCVVDVGTWSDGSSDWKNLKGVLLNDGTNQNFQSGNGPSIVAPCQPTSTVNYSVVTKMQVVSGSSGCFGISVRGTPSTSGWQGYMVGIGGCGYNGLTTAYLGGPNYSNDQAGIQAAFAPGTGVHTYRVEANNNTVKFYVDNSLLLSLTDNRFLDGTEIGLWDQGIQLQVTSFQVNGL